MTTAHWIRNFVTTHADYKRDSVVSERINYDLVRACAGITYGELDCPELLMKHKTRTKGDVPRAMQKTDEHLANMAAKRVAALPDGVATGGVEGGDGRRVAMAAEGVGDGQ